MERGGGLNRALRYAKFRGQIKCIMGYVEVADTSRCKEVLSGEMDFPVTQHNKVPPFSKTSNAFHVKQLPPNQILDEPKYYYYFRKQS